MLRLQIIIVSTRPGRKGPAVATWFEQRARAHGAFEVEVVDLAEVGLPLLDEPEHPRLRKYQHDHTKRWSAIVERGDAYVFVTPEYNFAAPPSLLNAIDYLYTEWSEKPAAFVSYGGVSAGLRGVQMAKQTLTSVGVMPIVASVAIPMFASRIDADGTFASDAKLDAAAAAMLTDLARWATALAGMRAGRG
ncbi:NADPH-dependent FMN reductase [Luteitalea sp.]|jgi:NAD(P)H-dependent FMN reductase|uniref:NADPH-dependent FMN reductase n=1 Tax=Luteitalea sp. TaxID=2004800 RepID=UPI0037CA845D